MSFMFLKPSVWKRISVRQDTTQIECTQMLEQRTKLIAMPPASDFILNLRSAS